MARNSKIEWCDDTWNPVRGCTRVSEGCKNCYAERMAARFNRPGQWGRNLAELVRRPDGSSEARWSGVLHFNGPALDQPLRWRKPRHVFVCSTSDLFHENVPDEWIDQIFITMARCPQHTFQLLTKRPERMRQYMISVLARFGADEPSPNVWLGVSAEDQATADQRIPLLLDTPAAVRFLSAEPLLAPVDIAYWLRRFNRDEMGLADDPLASVLLNDGIESGNAWARPALHWVIAGGESGPRARPMHPDWARSLRDQCQAAGVAFFFKQWGEWGPDVGPPPGGTDRIMEGAARCAWLDSDHWRFEATGYDVDLKASKGCGAWVYRLGKTHTGRLLEGREWSEMPESDRK